MPTLSSTVGTGDYPLVGTNREEIFDPTSAEWRGHIELHGRNYLTWWALDSILCTEKLDTKARKALQ